MGSLRWLWRPLLARAGSFLRLFLLHFFRITDAVDDVLHVFDRDGLYAFSLQFGKEFGHAPFDVFGHFFAALTIGEIGAHILLILIQELVSIFVDVVERSKEIDGNILFHFVGISGMLVDSVDLACGKSVSFCSNVTVRMS